MYVNQIDDFIDKSLDKLAFDKGFIELISHKWVNFVEHKEEINNFLKTFFESLNMSSIDKLVGSERNVDQIHDIIKRYLAYYFFLALAYHYPGTEREYRNNLIQYSKLQETSTFTIRNFFDTPNNYDLIKYYRLIRGIAKVIMMTPVEKAAQDKASIADVIEFLNDRGQEYVDNYLLQVDNGNVTVNSHNLIKTIVFGSIYQSQERTKVFEILAETEEESLEYTYIDIVVTDTDVYDIPTLAQLFEGKPHPIASAMELVSMMSQEEIVDVSIDTNNNKLINLPMIMPIADDFLRYHQESYKTEAENSRNTLPLFDNNAQNVRELLLQQKRDKKSDTLVQLVINNIDVISEYYSPAIQDNADAKAKVDKLFKNIFANRKAVIHNYEEEVFITNKLSSHGKFTDELRASYLEMQDIINNAYFNFRDLPGPGTKLVLETEQSVQVLRYVNIEVPAPNEGIDVHSVLPDKTINLVGLVIKPFSNVPVMCHKRKDLIDIRSLDSANGFESFLSLIKQIYVDTIKFDGKTLFHDYRSVPAKYRGVIYWIYDPDKDTFESDYVENVNTTDTIKLMNNVLYNRIIQMMHDKLIQLVKQSRKTSIQSMLNMLHRYAYRNQLSDVPIDKYIDQYQRSLPLSQPKEKKVNKIQAPIYKPVPEIKIPSVKIDFVDPTHPQPFVVLKKKASTDGTRSVRCQHEVEWNRIRKLLRSSDNAFNSAMSIFMDKYAIKSTTLEFNCTICGMTLPIEQYVKDVVYDNSNDTYISQYVPDNTPLSEIDGYQPYAILIDQLDRLINNRMALITGINMFSGKDNEIYRKMIIKNLIDLMLMHNKVNLAKNISSQARADYFKRNYGVNDDYDEVIFFELPSEMSNDTDIDRFKAHNILIYFLICYMVELNGNQIINMNFDKFSSIYAWAKYGLKYFEGLKVRTNKTDQETVPVTQYPVLCYLIWSFSYLTYRFGVWKVPGADTKKVNLKVMQNQIHSFVDLFNSIIRDSVANNMYIYTLMSSKMFVAMNTMFKDRSIIELTKRHQIKFAERQTGEVEQANDYSVSMTVTIPKLDSRIIPDTFAAAFTYRDYSQSMYRVTKHFTDMTNCPNGMFKAWRRGESVNCPEKITGVVRDSEYFNYVMIDVAKDKRCLSGNLHDFVDGKCKLCNRPRNAEYSPKEIAELVTNLMAIIDKTSKADWKRQAELIDKVHRKQAISDKLYDKIKPVSVDTAIDKLMGRLLTILDRDADLGYDIPFFLEKTVYLVDHTYQGKRIEHIVLADDRISFQANQPHYKTDVFYYVDNKADVTIYYDAVTKRMLGYKPKHKEYVDNDIGGVYLKVNPSVRDKLALMAYPTQFVTLNQSSVSLDGAVRTHLIKLKAAIDTFCFIISQVKNDRHSKSTISSKYRMTDLKLTDHITIWEKIREQFAYQPVELKTIPDYLSGQAINRLDPTTAAIYSWLTDMLIALLNANEKNKQVPLAQLFIAITNYVWESNNTDVYRNNLTLRRFEYFINASSMMEGYYRHSYEAELEEDEDKELQYEEEQLANALDIEQDEADEDETEWMGATDVE